MLFVTLRIQLAENANKSYHDYKVILVLHIYNKSLGIRLAGHPENKNKIVVLRLFWGILTHMHTCLQAYIYTHTKKGLEGKLSAN